MVPVQERQRHHNSSALRAQSPTQTPGRLLPKTLSPQLNRLNPRPVTYTTPVENKLQTSLPTPPPLSLPFFFLRPTSPPSHLPPSTSYSSPSSCHYRSNKDCYPPHFLVTPHSLGPLRALVIRPSTICLAFTVGVLVFFPDLYCHQPIPATDPGSAESP
ncbi:hypothetical protein BASA61_002067 [Batrachochytrium salamandrivorans]|nr:hypothetical protein BASA61_002067 [Batrachochytrium salamandrivorans]